jgi:hypothetical protein
MTPQDAESILNAFLMFPKEFGESDRARYLEGIHALPDDAAEKIKATFPQPQPNRWRALLALLADHPIPSLLELLLVSYKRCAERPDAEAREKLDALGRAHPPLAEVLKKKRRSIKVAKLTFEPIPKPSRDVLTPLQKKQIAWFEREGGEWDVLEFFRVLDDKGAHRYDATIIAGDDGKVFKAGTNKAVAMFAQGGAEGRSEALSAALEQGLAEHEKRR